MVGIYKPSVQNTIEIFVTVHFQALWLLESNELEYETQKKPAGHKSAGFLYLDS